MKAIRPVFLATFALCVAVSFVAREGVWSADEKENAPQIALSQYLAALVEVDLDAAAELSAAIPDEDARQELQKAEELRRTRRRLMMRACLGDWRMCSVLHYCRGCCNSRHERSSTPLHD